MTTNLRTATPDDIPAIIALQTKIWEPTYRSILTPEQIQYMFDLMYSPEALTEQMTTKGHTFILAETEPPQSARPSAKLRPVGFASFGPADAEAGTTAGLAYKLHKIYVLPRTQGTGAGRNLLGEVERRCWQNGGEVLLLNVNRYNKARAFYERRGFVVVREEDIPVGPYWMNDFVMSKTLTAPED